MANSILPLIDIYPVSESGFEGTGYLHSIIESADDYADFIAYRRSHGGIQEAVADELSLAKSYKQCKRQMLYLKDVPSINKYRNDPENCCLDAVEKELRNNGQQLSQGQKLFHGGIFPLTDINGEPILDTEFVLSKPLSTSFCSMIAASNADTHHSRHLWIITISESCKLPAYVFSNASNQALGYELEVLLGTGAKVKCLNVRENIYFDVLEVIVT
ncbi:hypothetical protein PVK64_17680 [Aliivibrio sp. S4TY2]|uniref:hypothetical protein n=1 Tax=unclassified Aliivibrio TaxID=2645654 RepID=UPI00237888E0|nr:MULTISPECIES: hypothetical protein [unclassified Aliivibrio]MDD9157996.1 hypothetical protein [Aliivibrio sp. S4TY2]MDD9161961.1 hypothetical protein [Aliivibrio sp. S4TY1]MDD9165993.1 hypothetical protein [Aliivibrio sp. S4MY2]MDD9170041.1 hypothetical protein [Aliivibrio sp. S4MY4]MDD9187092.1 hypothetical protein [Aliivibrio sp. S4MY3]